MRTVTAEDIKDAVVNSSQTQDSRTVRDIKQALLGLLGQKSLDDITMSEIARSAGVSRSTLYNHFNNPAEIYELLRQDCLQQVRPLTSEISSKSTTEALTQLITKKSFCTLIRDESELHPIINESAFLQGLITNPEFLRSHDLYQVLRDAGQSDEQARAICAFQMIGCFTLAKMSPSSADSWDGIKDVIDRFIKGGLSALTNMP